MVNLPLDMFADLMASQLLRRDVIRVLVSRGAIAEPWSKGRERVVRREVQSTVIPGLAVVGPQFPANCFDYIRISLFSDPAEIEEMITDSFGKSFEVNWVTSTGFQLFEHLKMGCSHDVSPSAGRLKSLQCLFVGWFTPT